MLRILRTAVSVAWLTSTLFISGYGQGVAGVASVAGLAAAAKVEAVRIKPIHWVRHCHCRRHWVSRRSWVVRARYPQWGSCWQWRATHWGIGRVWNCYYIY